MPFRRGRMGPAGRGGARRRTRRRVRRRTVLVAGGTALVVGGAAYMLGSRQRSQIEQETGRSVDEMDDEELEAELKKRGIEPTEAGTAESPSDESDYIAELERLGDLRDKNVISEEEFEAKKREILGR